MYQIKYRFIDKSGKTRKTLLVTMQGSVAAKIEGTASELQTYAALDGSAQSVGALKITAEYL